MPPKPKRVLIVEDELLIASQLAMIIESLGHEIVGLAAGYDEACDLAAAEQPDLAFVDVNLGEDQSGIELVQHLRGRYETEIVFTTASQRRLPNDFCGAVGVVEKPFTRNGLVAAIRFIIARLENTPGMLRKPDSLTLSPEYSDRWSDAAVV